MLLRSGNCGQIHVLGLRSVQCPDRHFIGQDNGGLIKMVFQGPDASIRAPGPSEAPKVTPHHGADRSSNHLEHSMKVDEKPMESSEASR